MGICFERDREKIDESNVFIKSKTSIDGTLEFPDITGLLWNIFYIHLEEGEFSWKTKRGIIKPASNKFFIFLPKNSLCIDLYNDAKINLVGLYSISERKEFRPYFINLEEDTCEPQNYEELLELGNSSSERHFIDFNDSPSELGFSIKSIIDREFSNGIDISYICEEIKKAPAIVSREFKKEFGMGAKTYLNLVRINYAEFLLGIEKDIKDVVFDVGFKDFSRFYKVFKKKIQDTPKGIKSLVK